MRTTRFWLLVPLVLTLALVSGALSAAGQSRPKALPKPAPAQTNEAPAKAKQPVAGPFNGKLAAIDKAAKSIKVGKRTFQITPETKLRRANQPAKLEDAVVGEKCSGYVKPTEDGRWVATTVNFGPKSEAGGAPKQQKAQK